MIYHLYFYATGGKQAIRLLNANVPTEDEIVTEDYNGQCLSFSEEMTIIRSGMQDVKFRRARFSLTPDRAGVYVEIGDDYLNQVFIKSWPTPVNNVRYCMFELQCDNETDISFEAPMSVFDDYDTKKIVNVTCNKEAETVWYSSVGGRTIGKKLKFGFSGLFIYHIDGSLMFSCYFDELEMTVGANKRLTVKVLVQNKVVQTSTFDPYFSKDNTHDYSLAILVEEEDVDTDDDEDFDFERKFNLALQEPLTTPLSAAPRFPPRTPPPLRRPNSPQTRGRSMLRGMRRRRSRPPERPRINRRLFSDPRDPPDAPLPPPAVVRLRQGALLTEEPPQDDLISRIQQRRPTLRQAARGPDQSAPSPTRRVWFGSAQSDDQPDDSQMDMSDVE